MLTNNSLKEMIWVNIGIHTPGSIAVYHQHKKILFIGDEICFFGLPIVNDILVSEANDLRNVLYESYLSGRLKKYFKIKKVNIQKLAEIIKKLGTYDVDYLCTGHGVVLEGNISLFLNRIAANLLSI